MCGRYPASATCSESVRQLRLWARERTFGVHRDVEDRDATAAYPPLACGSNSTVSSLFGVFRRRSLAWRRRLRASPSLLSTPVGTTFCPSGPLWADFKSKLLTFDRFVC